MRIVETRRIDRWRLIVLFPLLLPGWTFAQMPVQCTTNYYSVTGATLFEIHQSFREARPWKDKSSLDGMSDWRVDWRFTVREMDGRCRLKTLTTKTTIAITLPRWDAPATASPAVKQAWERYVTALGRHEYGHAQFAMAAAAELQKRIKELGEESDCDILRKKINDRGDEILRQYKKQDDAYDQRTQHGATQGARLPSGSGV